MDQEANPTTNEEQSETQLQAPAESEEAAASGGYVAPRGAFAFVLLMLLFYLGYWFISYFEIFVLRGA